MNNHLKNRIVSILIICFLCSLTACSKPYKESDILCKYDDMNCLYYTKDTYKKYKYSDYIFDDVSNDMYKKSTPNIADYRTGAGILDYDIEKYVNARMDYAIKNDLIEKYRIKLDSICATVHDGYFEQKNSHVYFYDLANKKSTLLYNVDVTNISYDDEVPTISFDIPNEFDTEIQSNIEGRRIMLSDIIAANTTIDGYMKVILGTGKIRVKYFLDKKVDDSDILNIASNSSINND